MKAYPQNLHSDDTVYASVRICGAEHAELRKWMHTHPDQQFVSFPHGVRLTYRSKGWWRLTPSNTFRAVEKVKQALVIIRKFAREYQQSLMAELRRELVMSNPALQAVAFVADPTMINGGEYHVRDKNTNSALVPVTQFAPAPVEKLQALAERFSHHVKAHMNAAQR